MLRKVAVSTALSAAVLATQLLIDTRGCFRFLISAMTHDAGPACFHIQNFDQFRRPFGNR